jgi:predicted ATPase/DNA-binding SARP family transcriptional activator
MLEVKFLGQFVVLQDGKPIQIPTRNAQSLFAYLVLNAGKAYRRENLAGLLWPDSSEDNARSNLRHELWRLRKALEAERETCFFVDDLSITFNSSCNYSLDVKKLEEAPLASNLADELIGPLSGYAGDLLPGFYDEWVHLERDRVYAVFEARITRLLELLQTEGRWPDVLEWGMRWISLGRWPEPAYRALMTAYANSGDLSKAAATYERLSQGLQKDLGVKPSEQTHKLYTRIKTGWKIELLKEAPTRGSQAPVSPPEKLNPTFSIPLVRRSNLPRPLTSFIGREKEILQAERLVSVARLVTITGSGGVGKTRLAIQIATELSTRFEDGICWVDLASLFETPLAGAGTRTGVDVVTQAVVKALRLPESPGLPLLEGIYDHLQDKHLLLVLDNCEHLIGASAALAESLLANCPLVTILATSREALGVPGEKAWTLPSLSLPDQSLTSNESNMFQSEAVSLFVERAGDALPGYKPSETDSPAIAQICLRLDGIPLAIELAAVRMNMLSAQEIAARLDQRFSLLTGGRRTVLPRHQTLQAAIEWSYDLLISSEQVLFRRLAIFAGSFTLEAAEAICAAGEIRSDEVLPLVGRLVDKSLLNVEPPRQDADLPTRYRFLDTIRSFGRLKEDQAEETGLMRSRYAAYYVHLVETAEPELNLQNESYWYRLLLAEHDNIRAVVEWGAEFDQAESALRLVGALVWFWFRTGSNREGCDLAVKALSLTSAAQNKNARARALNTAGFMQCLLGNTTLARRSLDEAQSILRASDDEAGLAWSLQFMGLALAVDQEYDLADAAFNEGLAITKRLEGTNATSFLHFLGDVELQKGDSARAQKTYEESANLLRAIGSKPFLAYPLRRLGYLALEQNDLSKAREYFLESLNLNHELGDIPGTTASLVSIAVLALSDHQALIAASLCGLVEKRLEKYSMNLLFSDQAEYRRFRNRLPSYLAEANFTAAFSEGWAMSEEQAIELAEKVIEKPIPQAYCLTSPPDL